VWEQIAKAGASSTVEAASMARKRVKVAGIRQSSHRSRTAKGETMLFLTLEDLEGMLDVVIFPDVYRRVKNTASTSQPILVSGTIEMDGENGEPLLRAERVDRIG
jgi:DNA polymerase III subunit alpha